MLLMRTGEQAWLLTADGGSHEFSKVRYFDGGYKLRDPNPRLGPAELVGMAVDEKGAHLSWSGERHTWIPSGWFQLSWVQ